MAQEESVGRIVYTIDADVAPLLKGGQQANAVLTEIEASIDASIAQFKKMDTQVSATAQAVTTATRSFGGFQNALRQGGYQVQDFIVQVQGGQSALVALSQQGSQLLGIFGAGGAVAGALLTIGTVIVGSLIAGMDNATMSTKALTEAQKRLADIFQVSANGVVVLSDKFAKLAETSENAARAQLTMALIDANNVIKASVKSVTELGDALGTWKAPLSAAISQMDTLTAKGVNVSESLKDLGGTYQGSIVGLNQLNQAVNNISESFGISADDALKLVQALAAVRQNANPDSIAALRDVTVDLSQKYGYANKALSEFTGKVGEHSIKSDQAAESTRLATDMLDGHRVASEEDARATEDNANKLKSYIQAIQDEGATIALSARQKAIYKAGTLGASKADLEAIDVAFDSIEAFKKQQQEQKKAEQERRKAESDAASAAKSAASQQESIAQKLEQLRQKSELSADSTQHLSREQAILSAQQSLGAAASKKQIDLAGQYAAKAYDNAAALKKQAEATQANKAAQQLLASSASAANPFTGVAEDPYAQVNLQEQQQLATYQQYRDQDLINQQTYEQVKTAIISDAATKRTQIAQQEMDQQVQNYEQLLGAASGLAGSLAGALGKAAGESSGAYQAMFAVSKAFAVAQASLGLYTSISQAMMLPWPEKIPAIAKAMTFGSQIVSSVSGVSYGGARKNGGPVSAGGMYQVGEGGAPEIFKANNGNQYMIPGDNGSVISNRAMNRGGGGGGGGNVPIVNNYVINQSTNAQATTTSSTDGNGNVTIQTIVSDIEEGGAISQAISRNFATNRRATE